MSIDSDNISHRSLENFIEEFDNLKDFEKNCVSWLKIDGVYDNSYKGVKFREVYLRGKNNLPLTINTAQFIYPMSPDLSTTEFKDMVLPRFDESNATCISTIDGHSVEPEQFFLEHKGEKLLYVYSFPAITRFDKRRRCFIFAYKNVSEQHIREHIKNSQKYILKSFLYNPFNFNIPFTCIVRKDEEYTQLFHNQQTEESTRFVQNLFDEEYRDIFKNKLKELS